MARTTREIAKVCPRCDFPGTLVSTIPQDDGSKVETYTCENDRCRWYNTNWQVQVLRDGTIPIRERGKEFGMTEAMENIARRNLEVVRHEMKTGEVVRDRNAFRL